MKIRKRLILPIILLAAAVIASNIIAVCGIRSLRADAADLAGGCAAGETALAEIRGSLTNMHRLAFSHIASPNYAVMTDVAAQIKDEEENLRKMVDDYRQYVSEDEKAAYSDLKNNCSLFADAVAEVLCSRAEGRTEEAYAAARGDAEKYAEAAEGCIDRLCGAVKKRAEAAERHTAAVCTFSVIMALVLTAACIVPAAMAVKTALNGVEKPLSEAARAMADGSAGMAAAAEEVRRRAESGSRSAEELVGLTGRLSENIRYAAERAAFIGGSVSGVERDIGGITEKCASVTGCSAEMTRRAEDMERTAEEHMRLIGEKAASISELLTAAIEESKSVDKVNSLTQDIMQISSTTNLIAMNASIEAKHAGAAGSGFSLVAGEIKQLADSCRVAATRIEEVNETVTAAVHNLSEQSEELLTYLNGYVLAAFRDTVKSGRQYRGDSENVEKAMGDLSGRAERLQASLSEITVSAGDIASALNESAGSISAVSEAGRSLAGDMNDITEKAKNGIDIAEELRRRATELRS